MIIEQLSTELLTFIGGGGATGLVAWIAYRKLNKRLKESEVKLAEANVEKAKIEGKSDEWHLYKEQLDTANARIVELLKINAEKEDRHMNDLKDWEERFTSQTTYLRGVQRDLIAANEREKQHIRAHARLEKERDHYKMWRCFREDNNLPEGCGRREPKQPIPIKYVPLEEECATCEVTDCSARAENMRLLEQK